MKKDLIWLCGQDDVVKDRFSAAILQFYRYTVTQNLSISGLIQINKLSIN